MQVMQGYHIYGVFSGCFHYWSIKLLMLGKTDTESRL